MFHRLKGIMAMCFHKESITQQHSLLLRNQDEREHRCNIFYFTQGVLVFFLVFGLIGGFLSAFDILYDKVMAYTTIGVTALVLSAVYTSGSRLWTNIVNFILVGVYVYIALTRFWYVNSGYYSILNKVTEEVRSYLDLYHGTYYMEKVENSYISVTWFVIFIGILLVILWNLRLEYHRGVVFTCIMVLPPLCFLSYFGKFPDVVYLSCLLSGFFSILLSMCFQKRHRRKRLLGYTLPVCFLGTVVLLWVMGQILPEHYYRVMTGKSTAKQESELVVKDLVLYGVSGMLGGGYSGSGVSGGMLSTSSMVRSDYETDLIVRFAPYSLESVYLKAYTGVEYDGYRWYPVGDIYKNSELAKEDVEMTKMIQDFRQSFELGNEYQGHGRMEVENVGANRAFEYVPYYTDLSQTEVVEGKHIYSFYSANRNLVLKNQQLLNAYLEVPACCEDAVRTVCKKAKLNGPPEIVASQLQNYFEENYTYTLKPGYKIGNSDYISYFLLQNKKGYCAHFASAAVMLFRNMGIPARFVEGYVISYKDIMVDGVLEEDAKYEEYYQGYTPIGKTGVITVEVPDANAHAWVEIYIEGKGWVVVDPTPAAPSGTQEEFWEVFGNFGKPELQEVGTIGNRQVDRFFANATNGFLYVFPVFLIGIGGGILGVAVLRKWKNRKMTSKEKMVYAYKQLCKKAAKRVDGFPNGFQLNQQWECISSHLRKEAVFREEFVKRLYDALFGPKLSDEEYDSLTVIINKIQKSL